MLDSPRRDLKWKMKKVLTNLRFCSSVKKKKHAETDMGHGWVFPVCFRPVSKSKADWKKGSGLKQGRHDWIIFLDGRKIKIYIIYLYH